MPLMERLEILRISLSCCNYRGDQHTHILISENDPSATLKRVTLRVPNGDWFSFDPDRGRGKKALMSPLLTSGAGYAHHRACDCVVLIAKENEIKALYIDLKSGNPTGYSGQFKSTRQFVRYILGLLEDFHGYKFLLEERFVVLYGGKHVLIQKKPTVPKTGKIKKTQPDKPYKRDLPNNCTIFLKELMA